MKPVYCDYMMARLSELMAIDSTTSDYVDVQKYLTDKIDELGYEVKPFNKGGFLCYVGGEGHPVTVSAHADDIGLMVHKILDNGTIQVARIGGLFPECALHANVRLKTIDGRVYTGTIRRRIPSMHVMDDDARVEIPLYEKNIALWLDEDVHTAADVRALGIQLGDVIALDPMYQVTPTGYIKSRFLDDKAAIAIVLTYLYALKAENRKPGRKTSLHFSMYEEIGHGGSCGIPEDSEEFLAIDCGCASPGQQSDEHKVTILTLDSRYPYHREVIAKLIGAAKDADLNYAVDVHLPHYGTDGVAALNAGHDVRVGAFGPGVLETHGYERTHMDAMKNTFDLLNGYIG